MGDWAAREKLKSRGRPVNEARRSRCRTGSLLPDLPRRLGLKPITPFDFFLTNASRFLGRYHTELAIPLIHKFPTAQAHVLISYFILDIYLRKPHPSSLL